MDRKDIYSKKKRPTPFADVQQQKACSETQKKKWCFDSSNTNYHQESSLELVMLYVPEKYTQLKMVAV